VPSGDHYQCYKSKDLKNPKFQSILGVSLIDQFGSSTAEVKKPFLVCAPVDKDGSGVVDPDEYMCCYKIKGTKLDPEARVETGDQFGTLQQSFKKAQLLCQPCSRTVLP